MNLLDISINILLLIIAFNLKHIFNEFDNKDKKTLNLLLVYHIAISIFFHFYILSSGGDAIHYWEVPNQWEFSKILNLALAPSGTGMIYLFNYIPAKVLQLSFFTGNMIYSLFGFIGFIYLFKLIKINFDNYEQLRTIKIFKIPLIPLIWFLPNFHFWTSGIGKDALLFTAIILIIYAIRNFQKRFLILSFASLIILAVRPHIFLFLIMAFSISFIFDGRIKAYQKTILFLILLGVIIAILPFVMNFIQLDSFETEAIEQYATNKSSSLSKARTSSGIDTTNYPFPLKFFTFLYRPLFFDINGVLAILSSFENLLLLVLTVFAFLKKPFRVFKNIHFTIKAGFLFFLIGSVAFSLILGNLGIMLRQKNMLMPWLVLFCLSILYSFNKSTASNETINNHQ